MTLPAPIDFTEGRSPWEKQKGETDRAFRYFQVYRNLGHKRSYVQIAEAFSISTTRVNQLGRRYRWRERAEAWDMEEDRHDLEAIRRRRRESDFNLRRIGAYSQSVAIARLRGNADQGIRAIDPNEMGVQDVVALLNVGIKADRLGLGAATENISDVTRIPASLWQGMLTEVMGAAMERMEQGLQPGFVADCRAIVERHVGR